MSGRFVKAAEKITKKDFSVADAIILREAAELDRIESERLRMNSNVYALKGQR